MIEIIDAIDWDKQNGLIPAIVQDGITNEVLMLAYMNKKSLALTIKTNFVHYFSRSKKRLWKKGETSGHTQEVKSILLDCDNDTILLKVTQKGVACHTGRPSCFFTNISTNKNITDIKIDTLTLYSTIDTLYHIIQKRKNNSPEKSWTAKLLQGSQNSMLKKIMEESGEFVLAIKDNNENEIIYEGADLVYHCLVALASKNISPDRIKQELTKRFELSGIEEKNCRK
jgi:phosphoribosyl-ATP pyrophosphohydrolase/phosphoribosyl-AMP cyclohydrolase